MDKKMRKVWIGAFFFMITAAGFLMAVSGKIMDAGVFDKVEVIVIDPGHGGC